MSGEHVIPETLRKSLRESGLPFHSFMAWALYDPDFGYYSRSPQRVGKAGDFVTSPTLSPAFSFALARLIREFLGRVDDAVCSVVDIGCGDGTLIRSLSQQVDVDRVTFYGVDQRVPSAQSGDGVVFLPSVSALPREGAHLLLSNELFDALPFARLVQRGADLREMWVVEHEQRLRWEEREADAQYRTYLAERGIELADGQYADVSLEWGRMYEEIASTLEQGLVVTFDYGYPERQLFDVRARPFGTAAAYRGQTASTDLLADPGEQDLTAHINFSDLIRSGEAQGLATLFFERQARFLLSLGITEHDAFTPIQEVESGSADENLELLERREEARRLILPADLGHDIRVLVQGKGVPMDGWSFQRRLF
ncbi:MAG TPA: SAM-dependent methyltransferase [Thermoanaerobaculia bacterium]|nr:SAM-dependent methyltransferase [Thermoanaerobaculia bacterium]